MGLTYQHSGVNLQAAEESTKKIAALAKSTFNARVLKDIGLFAGFYELDLEKYSRPVIVSSIDGVGTKLKIAFLLNRHNTVGQDLVNHCVNDIMTCGADPLFFLDYVGLGRLDPQVMAEIVGGMAKACQENECALIGGETAEMPGFYAPGDYDLAGTIIGAVNRDQIIDGSRIQPGDRLIALPSTGLHTNGYSLARKVLLEKARISLDAHVDELSETWGDALLRMHKSYRLPVRTIRGDQAVCGISHITGGGIEGNTNRLLREGLKLHIDYSAWQIPPLFQLIQNAGEITDTEMRRVFNLGVGIVFIVHQEGVDRVVGALKQIDETPIIIGEITQ